MDSRFVEGQKVTLIGLLFNIILAAGKGFAGVVGFSQALIADSVESVSDIIATVFVLISMRISGMPTDPEHPYGHFKIEQLAAAFVGLMISLAGLAIIILATLTIIQGKEQAPTFLAVYVAIGVIIIKETLYQYTIRVGKKIDSMAIIASAWDHRKDAMTTMGSLAGIIGARLGILVLDPIAAILVAAFILRIGYLLCYKAANELLDISPPTEILDKITDIALSIDGIEHVTDIKARKTGPYLIVDLKLEIDSQMSVIDSHQTASKAKKEVMSQMPDVSDVMTHVNPHIKHD